MRSPFSNNLVANARRVAPFDADQVAREGKGFFHNGNKYIHHSDLAVNETAYFRLYFQQIAFFIALFVVCVVLLAINWHAAVTTFIAIITTLYFADLLFNLYLIYRSFSHSPEIHVSDEEIAAVEESDWPSYTVLCPLYKEWRIMPQFVQAMSRLDYPKSKLQVMLLLEEDDTETVEKIEQLRLPSYFNIVIVPHSFPKTKPKACNYGLTKATGEHIVIYDAEDIPDPLQLKKAVVAFQKSDDRVVCIQAKLNFYNPHQNILTKAFTAEYSLWFDLVLTGLQSIHAPIPLGGTSNHFRTKDILALKGWDSFNVTEDCDLGIRLVKKGLRTAIVESTTQEEANSDFKNWFWQRTRWIKGYMQTYLVHMRNPREFMTRWDEPHVITFQLIVGGKVTSMLINPIMWALTIAYFVFRARIGPFIDSFFPAPVLYMAVFSLIAGNFLYMYYYMIGCAKRGYDQLVKYTLVIPMYWLVMSAAAYMALYKLITKPHQWSKTVHGLHLAESTSADQDLVFIDGLGVEPSVASSTS